MKKVSFDSVCITFDKMDKIGAEGVIGELTDKGFDGGAIAKFGEVIAKPLTVESVKDVCGEESAESIETIINAVENFRTVRIRLSSIFRL